MALLSTMGLLSLWLKPAPLDDAIVWNRTWMAKSPDGFQRTT